MVATLTHKEAVEYVKSLEGKYVDFDGWYGLIGSPCKTFWIAGNPYRKDEGNQQRSSHGNSVWTFNDYVLSIDRQRKAHLIYVMI